MSDDRSATDGPPESSDTEILQQGPFSTVTRVRTTLRPNDAPCWLVIKSGSARTDFAKEPHDIVKELRHLLAVRHHNIIEVIAYRRTTSTLSFQMPYVPYTLTSLLASPAFSPYPSPFSSASMLSAPDPRLTHINAAFEVLAKSLAFQICVGLAYLHKLGIAHRDVKPGNVLITEEGCAKIIDFGISWSSNDTTEGRRGDVWPEEQDKLYFEVSTGPYRAPELLFGTRSYDPFAIDRWSLGATLAEFFTPLRLHCDDDDEHHDEFGPLDVCTSAQEDLFTRDAAQTDLITPADEVRAPAFVPSGDLPAFISPSNEKLLRPGMHWARYSLFNGSRGEIGLAWSIFRVCGTPTEETWPTFKDLPDAQRVTFVNTPPTSLSLLLPNRPSTSSATILNLVGRFLAYPPSDRLSPACALRDTWFTSKTPQAAGTNGHNTQETPLLLAPGYWDAVRVSDLLDPIVNEVGGVDEPGSAYPACTQWEGTTLAELVRSTINARS